MLNAEKTKTCRSKQRNFSLRKALMAQARLQNRLLEEKSEELYNKIIQQTKKLLCQVLTQIKKTSFFLT